VLAPKVTEPQPKAAASPTNIVARQSLTLPPRRTSDLSRDNPGVDHEHQAGDDNAMARETPRPLSWDFAKIPLFPPDRANRRRLALGPVDDPLEQEADRIANRVTRMQAPGQPGACMQAG
jgi:hypothetical protein